jgi:predicted ATPase with chaperone activity
LSIIAPFRAVREDRRWPEQRFGDGKVRVNARMGGRLLRKSSALDAESKTLLQTAMGTMGLSARAHDRIDRLSELGSEVCGGGERRAPLADSRSAARTKPARSARRPRSPLAPR